MLTSKPQHIQRQRLLCAWRLRFVSVNRERVRFRVGTGKHVRFRFGTGARVRFRFGTIAHADAARRCEQRRVHTKGFAGASFFRSASTGIEAVPSLEFRSRRKTVSSYDSVSGSLSTRLQRAAWSFMIKVFKFTSISRVLSRCARDMRGNPIGLQV